MSRLTLRLPTTLHQKLMHLAQGEGISLNQYIVYTLTHQAALAYTVEAIPPELVEQQRVDFDSLLAQLGRASQAEIDAVLDEREVVPPSAQLSQDTIARLQQRIQNAKNQPTGDSSGHSDSSNP